MRPTSHSIQYRCHREGRDPLPGYPPNRLRRLAAGRLSRISLVAVARGSRMVTRESGEVWRSTASIVAPAIGGPMIAPTLDMIDSAAVPANSTLRVKRSPNSAWETVTSRRRPCPRGTAGSSATIAIARSAGEIGPGQPQVWPLHPSPGMRGTNLVVTMAMLAGMLAPTALHHAPASALAGAEVTEPKSAPAETRTYASWYGDEWQGRPTASGEPFDMHDLTAAHPTLPFGTRLHVTNLRNGRSVTVRVNDRGPAVQGRGIDLSYAAARALGAVHRGVVPVRIEHRGRTHSATRAARDR
jgi:rare lipoprotein A